MNGHKMNRRDLLKHGATVGAAGSLLILAACGKGEKKTACYDADKLTSGEKSLRESLHYVDTAPDQAKSCQHCSFFQADEAAPGCGHCQILNGTVPGTARCDSWSQRA